MGVPYFQTLFAGSQYHWTIYKFFHMRTSRQNGLKRPEVRSLKIQSRVKKNLYSETYVSEILLNGKSLTDLGFLDGGRVSVLTMPKLLIIRLVE